MSCFIAKSTCAVTTIAILLCSPAVQSQAVTPAAQELKPILGMVIPNKTTLAEVESALKEKGCNFEEKTEEKDSEISKSVDVQQGCFDLPGSPVIAFVSAPGSQTVDGVLLAFKNGGTKQMFNQYLQTLIKSYGNPADIQPQFLWNMYFWPKMDQKFFVNFIGSEEAGPFILVYSMGPGAQEAYDKWQEMLKGQEPGKEENKGEVIENL